VKLIFLILQGFGEKGTNFLVKIKSICAIDLFKQELLGRLVRKRPNRKLQIKILRVLNLLCIS